MKKTPLPPPKTLEPPKGKSGLSPLKKDSYAKKKHYEQEQEELMREKEDEYQIDEEGYLMDLRGEYLRDQFGNLIQLDEDELRQL